MTSHVRNKEDIADIFTEMLTEEEIELYLNLEESKIQEFQEIFNIFDKTGDGTIDNTEIGEVMEGLGERLSEEEIERLIREIDYDGDGEVDFDEFMVLMVKTLNQSAKAEEELIMVFNDFDKDGDGSVCDKDLYAALHEMGYDITQDEAQDMIHFFDKDGDGDINFAEFVRVMLYDTTDASLFDQ